MELIIKGMVCRHCVEAVKEVFSELNLSPDSVTLGRASFPRRPDDDTLARLSRALEEKGFSLVNDPDSRLVEEIKLYIIEHVRHPHECKLNLSGCLEKKLGATYDTMSRIFSSKEGRTIEKFHMAQRVEWVKELLGYGQMSISEIADYTGYSSVAHLSRMFKTVTGMTPTEYIKTEMPRKGLNEV